MANENKRDSWELENGIPHRDAEESNSDEIQKDTPQTDLDDTKKDARRAEAYDPANDPWHIDPDDIDADYITPQIPRALWDSFIWQAVRVAIPGSETRDDVIRKVKQWNTHNNPQIPETDLVRKVLWALRTFDDSPWKKSY